MVDEVRLTVGVSNKAKDNMVNVAKAFGITQWEATDIALRLLDVKNPEIKAMAMQIKSKNELIKDKKKEINKKLQSLTIEQIEAILNNKQI